MCSQPRNPDELSRTIVRVLTDDANLVNIRTFAVAAQYLSFKAAARFLCLTPGAVSHRIAKLEELLGLPLFNRLTRSVALTPEGERLMHVCLNAFNRFRDEVSHQVGQEGFSTLTIHSHHSIAIAWLIPRLQDFQSQHPGVQIHLQTGNDLVAFSGASAVDMAVYYADGAFPGLESTRFMNEEIFPVCSPAYAKSMHLYDNPAMLEQCTLISDAAAWHFSAPTAEWQAWCNAQDLELATDTVRMTFDTSLAAAVAACHHAGVAIGRRRLVEAMLNDEKLINPFPNLAAARSDFGYYAVWPRSTPLSSKVELFLHWLREQAQC